jgi:hypothetical protein
MPLGPLIPIGVFATMSMPASFEVGTSGQFLVLVAPRVTSSRSLPALTCGRPCGGVSNRIDMTAEEGVHCFPATLERNMDKFDALLFGNSFHRNVMDRAHARCPVG